MVKRITFGNSYNVREEHLLKLGEAWRQRELVLFLGAGVSSPYGLPSWDGLIRKLLVHKSSRFKKLWPHYQTAVATQLARSESFDFSPLSLASVVKYKISGGKRDIVPDDRIEEATRRQFGQITKQFLYHSLNLNPAEDTALNAIVELVVKSEKERRRVPAVLTSNFDDLVETKLRAARAAGKRELHVQPVFKPTRRLEGALPVIHVNGFLPQNGAIPPEGIVLAEDEFHQLTYSPFDWATATITNYLRNYTVLFVGLSMSDPNLRRLLYATRPGDKQLVHFLLRKEHRLSADERLRLVQNIKESAREMGESLGRREIKDDQDISQAIDVMLEEAHTYDREIFRSMGVGAIWFEEFADVPKILRAIPSYARRPKGK